MLEQNGKGRARARLAVFFVCIFAVHVIGLMALLMVGCKREQPAAEVPGTNAVLPMFDSTNVPLAETSVPVPPTVAVPPVPPIYAPPVEPAGGMREYVVGKGDSFYSIGKKLDVSMKAIQEANPGVNSARLKIGQKLMIPAPASSAAVPASQILPEGGMGSEQVYVVKSGDTLTKIASTHGTTVKALRAANGLRTDNIKVGQKLKVPARAAASTAPAISPAPPIPAMQAEPVPLPTQPNPAPTTPPSP